VLVDRAIDPKKLREIIGFGLPPFCDKWLCALSFRDVFEEGFIIGESSLATPLTTTFKLSFAVGLGG
jgi:hypothetical protein